VAIIFGVRILVNKGRISKAKKLAEEGEKGKALTLFLKSLKFQLGNKKAYETLDYILDLFKSAGYGEEELSKIKNSYSTIHNEFNEEMSEIEKKKMKDKKKMDAIGALDKEYKEKFDKEFVPTLPQLT
jgi:hypothetical protein